MKTPSRFAQIIPAALMLLASTAALAQTPPAACEKVTEQEVSALFDRWNASLKTLDPMRVAANYAPKTVLLATVANEPLTTQAEISAYFLKFLKAEPKGTINKRFVTLGCNTAQDVGTYTFSLKDGSKVAARYTFDYVFTGGEWKISHHHSSAFPEKS